MIDRGNTVGSLGETALIRRIARVLGPPPRGVVGIGDDAAVTPGRGGPVLHTVDVQVEGTHFHRWVSTPEEVGWKALAVSVSDIAAMGGRPETALVSLILPADATVSAVERLYRGMRRMALVADVQVVGGNVARGEQISITVSLTGALFARPALRRDGAKPGDRLFVTGRPGLADLGRRILEHRPASVRRDLWADPGAHRAVASDLRTPLARAAMGRFLLPDPRTAAAEELLEYRPTALIDTSDGLARDLSHLVNAQGAPVVHADALPLDSAFAKLAARAGREEIAAALQGGEDYELLFTLRPAAAERLRERGALAGVRVHEIGEFVGSAREPGVDDVRGVTPLRPESDWHFPR